MTNDEGMTKSELRNGVRHFCIRASFVIRHSCFVIFGIRCVATHS